MRAGTATGFFFRDDKRLFLISIFKALWHDPRMEDILKNSAFALMEQPAPLSRVAIPKLLTDADYRAGVLRNVSNPIVRNFFQIYEEHWDKRFREKAISPVLNKVNAFITNPLLRAIIGQTKSSFDFRWLMDSGKILLCDLSKGGLGEDVSALHGSLVMTKLSLAALSRQDVPENDRRIHVLYADEVQNFVHGVKLSTILSEARKYRLALTIATQTINQVPEESIDAWDMKASLILEKVSFRFSRWWTSAALSQPRQRARCPCVRRRKSGSSLPAGGTSPAGS